MCLINCVTKTIKNSIFVLFLFVIVGCNSENKIAKKPLPQEPVPADIGYFCNMNVINHKASKGQIFLTNKNKPLWFSTIRDVFTYINSPDEPQNIAAIYVNDMGEASWDKPEKETWIEAKDGYYVLNSSKLNGMGGKSIVPFKHKKSANAFIKQHGGSIYTLNDIPKKYIFEADIDNHEKMMHHDSH